MKILVTGATGLIGARLRSALMARGHEVTGVARHPPSDETDGWVGLDLARASSVEWQLCLAGVEVVVNCVGIFRESPGQRFEELHHRGPARLFDACANSGVRRVVQVSALGADAGAQTAYHRSKRAADEHLLQLPLDAVVVQPSLVFASDGASSRSLLTWASLPVCPLPAGGRQAVQPIVIDDVIESLLRLVLEQASPARSSGRRIALVGPRAVTLADYLDALRQGLGGGRALRVGVPRWVMRAAARVGDVVGRWQPQLLLSSDSWQMLERGNVADAGDITALLGRPPVDVRHFIQPAAAEALRQRAALAWLQPLARLSIALVWIVTAFVSAFVYPVAESHELLARTGVPAPLRPAALYGAALLDLLLGLGMLLPVRGQWWRPWLYAAQAGLIVLYTLLISWRLPEFWTHPYGPLLKNLPMLALIAWLAWLEPKGARR